MKCFLFLDFLFFIFSAQRKKIKISLRWGCTRTKFIQHCRIHYYIQNTPLLSRNNATVIIIFSIVLQNPQSFFPPLSPPPISIPFSKPLHILSKQHRNAIPIAPLFPSHTHKDASTFLSVKFQTFPNAPT